MSNKGNRGKWDNPRFIQEKLYLKCPPSFSRNIESILSDGNFDFFHFPNHGDFIETLRLSGKKNRGNKVIYHFTQTFGDRGIHETKRIVTDLKHYLPEVKIIGLYRNNPIAYQLLATNGVHHPLEYSTKPEFTTSLQKLLL